MKQALRAFKNDERSGAEVVTVPASDIHTIHRFQSMTMSASGSEDEYGDVDGSAAAAAAASKPAQLENYVLAVSAYTRALEEHKERNKRRRAGNVGSLLSHMVMKSDSQMQPQSLLSSSNFNHVLVPGFYFLLGAFLATPSLAQKYFAIRVLDIKPSSFGYLYVLAVWPWFMKPFFGLVSDTRPIMQRHRVPYIVVCAALATLTWALLALPGQHSRTTLGFGALTMLSNVFITMCDVCVDTMVAKAAREELVNNANKGRSQSIAWLSRHTGSLFGIVVGAYMVATVHSLHTVFAVTAVYPFILFIGSLFLAEKKTVAPYRASGNDGEALSGAAAAAAAAVPRASFVEEARSAVRKLSKNRVLVDLAKFIFLFAATPNSATTFSFYAIQYLKFSERFMGVISVAACVAMIAGLVLYNLFFKQWKTRRLVRFSIVVGTALATMPLVLVLRWNRALGIEDEFFALGDDVAEALSSQLSAMPIMVAIAAVCPEGDEGVSYAGMMSVSNFGGAVSTALGAFITHALDIHKDHYDNMWLLVLLCTSTNMLPYFFVHWLPDTADKKEHIAIETLLADSEIAKKKTLV